MEPQPEVIYQVTLPSGMVVTSPREFGLPRTELGATGPIITLDGRVLVAPAPPVPQRPAEDDNLLGAESNGAH